MKKLRLLSQNLSKLVQLGKIYVKLTMNTNVLNNEKHAKFIPKLLTEVKKLFAIICEEN